MPQLDYDNVAAQYDQRYASQGYPGTRACLSAWLAELPVAITPRVLELGCGTGKWLEYLAAVGCEVAGIEPSRQMLSRARERVSGELREGRAEALPWDDASFDGVVCVNALHHFVEPERALREAWRVLRPGGMLLSIGLDPHAREGRWYVYEFFPEALVLDRARFAPLARRSAWLQAAGFEQVVAYVAEPLRGSRTVAAATQQGLLERSFTSQLSMLADADYTAGLARIEQAAQTDPQLVLEVDLDLFATRAQKPRD